MGDQRGFTMIEMLLAVAMIAIVGAITIPVLQTFQVKNDLDVAVTNITHGLRRAQVLSQASKNDTTWGVSILSGTITVFEGASYAARDTEEDETYDLPSPITPTGVTEIVFSKMLGEPSATGTLTLTTSTGLIATIDINEKGLLTY